MKSIQAEYKNQSDAAKQFFCQPIVPDWTELSKTILGNFRRKEFLQEIVSQNKDAVSARSTSNLKLLQKANTLLVVTGQQLGLFISPLYTIYKTMTALRLAQMLNDTIPQYRFVPVFWLEGEDHDYDEVDHAWYWTKDGVLQQASLAENKAEAGFSLAKRCLPQEVTGLLHTMQKHMQPTEFSAALFEKLREIYQPERLWIEAFSDQMRWMFDECGLLFFNPSAEVVKQNSTGFFEELINNNSLLIQSFQEKTELLRQFGFNIQAPLDQSKSYISISDRYGKRQALLTKAKGKFHLKNNHEKWNASQLVARLREQPGRFSSTVLTRPLWQSWMLPVVSCVVGPAEIAYWAQLQSAFERFGLVMPHVQPRFSATLIEPKNDRLLAKYKLDAQSIPADRQRFIREYLYQNRMSDMQEVFQLLNFDLKNFEESLQMYAQQLDETLLPQVDKSFGSVYSTLERLQNRLLKRLEDAEHLTVSHLRMIHESFFPDGKPQERLLSPVYYLNKFGKGWLDGLFNHLNISQPIQQYLKI